MQLTRRGEYALRSMVELAGLAGGDTLAHSHDVAANQEIPPKFLPQIINELSRAGLVETVRGAAGGIRLGRPADQISVADVLQAVEGALALNRCLMRDEPCERKAACPLACVWTKAQDALMAVLAGTTLAELVDQGV